MALPKIALMMIVKNEGKTLPQLLPSVKSLISEWVIIDTGSSDDTKDIIFKLLEGIPGNLIESEWVNFGHNRSELLRHFPKSCEYALLLDADHIVAIDKETIKSNGEISLNIPDADCLMLQVEDRDVAYRMPYFIRHRNDMHYEGATHEFLTADQPLVRVPYDEIRIRHTAEGGSRGDKFERDLRLLNEEITWKPSARNFFYLGQTLASLNRVEEAIAAYEKCVTKTFWDEEKYLALLRMGRLYLYKKMNEIALVKFLQAHEAFKERCEASLEAGKVFTSLGLRRQAIEVMKEGAMRCPQGGILLIETWVCQWGIETELGSALWWEGEKALAKALFEKVLAKPNLPSEAVALLEKNLSFC